MFVFRLRDGAALGRVIALASFALALSCALARAGQDAPANPPPNDGVIKEVLKKVGLAVDPGPPADFVLKSRPAIPGDYVPVGRKPYEHPIKAKTADELKALEADLDKVKTQHDAIRSGFPPAAKAMAEAEAAKAAKEGKPKKKNKQPPANP